MASYTRQSTFSDGDLITAELFNDEYNQLLAAFENTTGHKHDGTVGEGPVISIIGDAGLATPLNKILIDTTNDHIEFWVDVSGTSTQQLYITDGAILPVTDNDIDLGSNSLQFKDLYINGTANIDTVDIDAGTIDGVTIGGNSAGAITGTTITATNFVIGSASINETELEILDGATLTTTELNYVDGVTSSIQTQIDTKAPLASPSLTGIPTAPTAASNTNTTQIATTAYVQSELTDLIDGAPGTLDTLNELAAAINDDANYNTTLTTALATKLPLAGGTMTGNVTYNDNVKAQFGTSQDLQIYHDGSNSIITDAGTGSLILEGTTSTQIKGSTYVILRSNAGENMLIANANGSVDSYYDGVKKLATTSTGIDVTGTVTADGVSVDGNINLGDNDSIYLGDSNDLRIYHDSGSSLIRNTTGNLYIQDDDGHVYIRPKSGQDGLVAIADGAVTLHHSGNAKLATTSTGIDVTGTVVSDGLEARKDTGSTTNSLLKLTNSAGSTTDGVGITFEVANTSGAGGSVNVVRDGSNFKPYMTLNTSANVSTTPLQRVRIDDTGIDVTGTVTADGLTVNSGATLINGSIANAPTGDGVHLGLTSNYAQMQLNGSAGGIIDFSTSGVDSIGRILYDQTSDYMRFDTNYSERMRLDSSGRLGIGTSSPNTPLDVRRSDASGAVAEFHNNVGYGIDIGTSTTDAYISSGYNQNFIFKTNAGSGQTERIRIDSSGNFLVGKTASDFTVAGHEMKPSSFAAFTRNGGTPLIVNRLSSDGDIIEFYKGTSSVGSIGTMNFGDMYLGTDDTGIYFNNGIDSISPINTTNQTVRDNAIDLGASNARFKDLYLSGTANFGSLSDGTITITGFVDEDNMSSNSATLVPTQQSVKAYVDSQVSSAGGNGISFSDNEKAQFGDGNDLQIYHDGNNSRVEDTGTGGLRLIGGNFVSLQSTSGENMVVATENGAVTLYHDNNAKLATTSTGIDVTGTANVGTKVITKTTNGEVLRFERASDSLRYNSITSNSLDSGEAFISFKVHDGVSATSQADVLHLKGNGNIGIGTSSPNRNLHIIGQYTVENSTSPSGAFLFIPSSDANRIYSRVSNASSSSRDFAFLVGSTEAMRIDSSGRVGIGTSSPDDKLHIHASSGDGIIKITGDGSETNGGRIKGFNGGLGIETTDGAGNYPERMRINSSGNVGIGTSSPADKLTVNGTINHTNSSDVYKIFSTGSGLIYAGSTSSSSVAFITGGGEKARLDTSGNLLVGKTSSGLNTAGVEFASSGRSRFTRDGNNVVEFNRKTSDGSIVSFSKDASLVGSIGVDSTDNLYIAGGSGSTKGLYFNDAGVIPATTGGGVVDNAVDLGQSGYRFKNLYLSGTAYAQYFGSSADTNTLIQFAGSDDIRFRAGGTEQMRIKTTGVGIGETAPQNLLHVKASDTGIAPHASAQIVLEREGTNYLQFLTAETGTSGVLFGDGSDVDVSKITVDHNTTKMTFTNETVDTMTLNGANVGIGTSSPSSKLTVTGDIEQTTGDLKYTGGINWDIAHHGASQNIVFKTTPSGGSATEVMRIKHDGSVGIGTASPASPLHVNGNVQVGVGNSKEALIQATNSGRVASNPAYSFNGDVDTGMFNPNTDNTIAFATGGSERARIDSSGHLLVGTTSVGYSGVDLTVGATTDSQNGVSIQTSTTGIGYLLFGDGTGASAYVGQIAYAHSDNSMQFDTAGAERARFDSSGNFLVGKTLAGATNTVGHELKANGIAVHTTDNTTTMYLNRKTSDGSIIELRKDNTAVGSIGTNSDALYISSPYGNDSGLRFVSGIIAPATTTGANRDAAIDLGYSSGRFKDIYLSGTVKLSTADNASNAEIFVSPSTDFAYFDHPSNGMIFRNTSGSERMRIDSLGRVGIGTSNPAAELHINDATGLSAIRLTGGASSVDNFQIMQGVTGVTNAGFSIYDIDATATRFVIDSSGNVGIGTTSPSVKLEIQENTNSADVKLRLRSFNSSSAGRSTYIAYNPDTRIMGFGEGGDELNIDQNGKVGIGTASPDGNLEVVASSVIDSTSDTVNNVLIGLQAANRPTIVLDTADTTYTNRTWNITNVGAAGSLVIGRHGLDVLNLKNDGKVGIGTSSPSAKLHVFTAGHFKVDTGSSPIVEIANNSATSSTSGTATLKFTQANTQAGGKIVSGRDGDYSNGSTRQTHMAFYTATTASDTEKMRITADGHVGIGTTSPVTPLHVSTAKSSVTDSVLTLQDTTETFGKMIEFVGEGSTDCRGIIGFQEPQGNAPELYIANGGTENTGNGVGLAFWSYTLVDRIAPCDNVGGYRDNAIDLGWSSARFDDIYATNGTIQTSDRNDKQDIQALTAAETRVATACKGLLRKFRWQDAVTEKGDEARYHFGIIAQDLQDAFTAEGLDAGDYGMFISQTWEDSNGVEQTRLGVRYSELLAFIIAAI